MVAILVRTNVLLEMNLVNLFVAIQRSIFKVLLINILENFNLRIENVYLKIFKILDNNTQVS